MLRLSVVIPTFNRLKILERTLAALAEQDFAPSDYEVVVVVDGSTDGTSERLRGWKLNCALRIIEAPHRGVSAARNLGIRAAASKLVLLLDDDLIAVPDLLRQHWHAQSESDPHVVLGPIYMASGSAQTVFKQQLGGFYDRHYRALSPDMDLRFPDGIPSQLAVFSQLRNASAPRDLLLRCGGFDEQMRAAEDLDLGLRLWRMGASFRYNPAATTYEFYVKPSWDYLRGQASALGAGDLITARKHPEYRPHSRLAHFAETPPFKKWIRSAWMRFPWSPVPLLALPLRLEKWFCHWSSPWEAGSRLFAFAETVSAMRGAVKAAGSWTALKSEFDRCIPALTYHHVGPPRPEGSTEISISPELFKRQMQWLAQQGYVGVAPSDWLRWLRDGKRLPDKPVLLTFDHAFADLADYALPILKQCEFRGGVFVVTGQMGGADPWDQSKGRDNLPCMTKEQIRYWARQRIEFGAHGRTYADLTQLSADQCREQMERSKSDLGEVLDSPAISFAYPWGKCNDAVHALVKGQFDLAFGTQEGMNYLRGDPHLLRRVDVGREDSLEHFGYLVRHGRRFQHVPVTLALHTRLSSKASFVSGQGTGQDS